MPNVELRFYDIPKDLDLRDIITLDNLAWAEVCLDVVGRYQHDSLPLTKNLVRLYIANKDFERLTL